MSKKFIQYIVIFLGILIIFSFIALIYGMYLKISTNSRNVSYDLITNSLNLSNNEKILDIEVIDENNLLIKIESSNKLKGAIYSIDQKKILEFIDK